jgi:hypothetical protein
MIATNVVCRLMMYRMVLLIIFLSGIDLVIRQLIKF